MKEIIPSPGIPNQQIFPTAVPGTFAVVHRAPVHGADCKAETPQRVVTLFLIPVSQDIP